MNKAGEYYSSTHRSACSVVKQKMRTEHGENVVFVLQEQRVAWAQAVFFLQQQNKDFKRLILSQRAAM